MANCSSPSLGAASTAIAAVCRASGGATTPCNNEDPSILSLPGRHLVVFFSNRTGGAHLFLTESTDGGASWSDAARIEELVSASEDFYPSLVECRNGGADQRTLALAWFRINATTRVADVWFSSSVDAGATFATPKKLTGHGSEDASAIDWAPRLASGADGTIHLVWASSRGEEAGAAVPPKRVWMMSSTDCGATWGPPVQVLQSWPRPPGTSDDFPSLALLRSAHGGVVMQLLFTRAFADGAQVLMATASDDGGATWSLPDQVAPPPGDDAVRGAAVRSWGRMVPTTGGVDDACVTFTSNEFAPLGHVMLGPETATAATHKAVNVGDADQTQSQYFGVFAPLFSPVYGGGGERRSRVSGGSTTLLLVWVEGAGGAPVHALRARNVTISWQ